MRPHDTALTALFLAFVHTGCIPGLIPAMLIGPHSAIDPGISSVECLAILC